MAPPPVIVLTKKDAKVHAIMSKGVAALKGAGLPIDTYVNEVKWTTNRADATEVTRRYMVVAEE